VRVALDEQIFTIQEYGGISRLFFELARQFERHPELGVEVLPIDSAIINRYVLEDKYLSQKLHVHQAKGKYRALAKYLLRRNSRVDADIVHNTFYLPQGLIGYSGSKRIVTIHDMIPEMLPKTRRRLDLLTLKGKYIQQADHIICVSAATRGDLLRLYPDVKAPISVVHHGVDPIFTPGVPKWSDLPDSYILFVGNRGQYKDALVLLKAFAQFTKEFPETTLLFVGGGHFNSQELSLMNSLGITNKTQHRILPDAEMSSAYGNALFTVFPSRFEGFGLPALESMACGTPTILANTTSLPEVGGNAAEYFIPGDDTDLAHVMLCLAQDNARQKKLSQLGIQRASSFSWERCASETADVYRQVLK
jgi:glycosyltransferase involved in cell wall biosynthesis